MLVKKGGGSTAKKLRVFNADIPVSRWLQGIPSDPHHNAPVTPSCDSGHRPIVLENRMMESYNDRCDQSSSSLVAEHRADVGGESRYRMRASGRDPYAR